MHKMISGFSELKLRQLDSVLNRWRNAELPSRPSVGWLKSIREALGITATQLAKRLGVATSSVTRLETSEADDTISLGTLRRAAEALDCELVYSLVPKKTLAETLEARASSKARHQMLAINHTMALEAQATSQDAIAAQTRALTQALLKGSRRTLWRDD